MKIETKREYNKRYWSENREKIREQRRGYYKRYSALNRKAITEKNQEWKLKRLYGLSKTAFELLRENQNNSCAVCCMVFSEGKKGVPHVDHCHETGKIRGLLCHSCNVALGYLKESALTCFKAASYLQSHGKS